METFSALLAIYAGNSPVTGEFPPQRPVTRSFDVFFHLRLNKQLSKQSFETLSRPLWRHCNDMVIFDALRLIWRIWATGHGTVFGEQLEGGTNGGRVADNISKFVSFKLKKKPSNFIDVCCRESNLQSALIQEKASCLFSYYLYHRCLLHGGAYDSPSPNKLTIETPVLYSHLFSR